MMMIARLLLLVAVAAVSACATPIEPRVTLDAADITTAMLLDASPVAPADELEDLSQLDILDVTPEMAAFLDEFVRDGLAEHTRLRALLNAVMSEEHFELVYDDQTRTAGETFRDRHGNCLSFTNMFVAMARYLDLDARYQEVEIPPDWSTAGHALLLSQHVNVFIDLSQLTDRVVDFNTEVVHFFIHDLKPNYRRQVISDERARAHYFNNVGVELMLLAGDSKAALANFRQSILEDPTFAPAWISLGILHRRDGFFEYAEASFFRALEVDPYSLVAMSNLASLYELQGRFDLAAEYRERVESHRMNNPYYRYELAFEAFQNGDYEDAIDHLEFAIRRQDHESEFYSLLSLSLLMTGDEAAAQRRMKQAEEVAREEADQQRYHRKLELMLGREAVD